MLGATMKKCAYVLVAVAMVFLLGTALAQDEDGFARLDFLVVKDYNGKPIRNASVVMHPVNKHGKQERGGLELKANGEGKCSFDGIPYGKLRVQVLARGFQTFGQDYEIDQPRMAITIKLKRPQRQYSIYRDQQNDKKDAPPPADENKDESNKPK
jgi:hypothetical protein